MTTKQITFIEHRHINSLLISIVPTKSQQSQQGKENLRSGVYLSACALKVTSPWSPWVAWRSVFLWKYDLYKDKREGDESDYSIPWYIASCTWRKWNLLCINSKSKVFSDLFWQPASTATTLKKVIWAASNLKPPLSPVLRFHWSNGRSVLSIVWS